MCPLPPFCRLGGIMVPLPHRTAFEQTFYIDQGKALDLFCFEKKFAKTITKEKIPNAFPFGHRFKNRKVSGVSLTEEVWIPVYRIILLTNKKPQITRKGQFEVQIYTVPLKVSLNAAITGGLTDAPFPAHCRLGGISCDCSGRAFSLGRASLC